MIDAINFVKPISRCDIQHDPRLVKMHCAVKPKIKAVKSKSINFIANEKNSPRNISGYFWRY